ncbi:D-serine ammonia-lyase [Pseudomaricurvus alkylphenolicus]|nr:D-serine ammonia-lyase [Pseudomaricurvus alkylphenolicus]
MDHNDGDVLHSLASNRPFLWLNPIRDKGAGTGAVSTLSLADVEAAEQRLQKFAPLLQVLFPELRQTGGLIESELLKIPSMQALLEQTHTDFGGGHLWLKADHNLPVAGSVKARGGIYEVLCFAEELAKKEGLLQADGDYRVLATPTARQLFEQYTVSVGSTGNLGLSIGVTAAALGFKACVHMSVEAKRWKKERLRRRGVEVIEHSEDYSKAVAAGREAAKQDAFAYFVDDENSLTLFMGYSVAALRLQRQLREAAITVDADHPLFVYIPCGVGGAPGGIAFGLKQIFGNAVHCFFAEPTQAPCMLLGMAAGFKDNLSVYDVGLQVDTEADGLAVSQASELVAKLMAPVLSGIFTVKDNQLFRHLYRLEVSESVRIEPSAAAGFDGPGCLLSSEQGRNYLRANGLEESMHQANHVVWSTGGRFVPATEYQQFHQRGEALCAQTSQPHKHTL